MLGLVWSKEDIDALASEMVAQKNTDQSLEELEKKKEAEAKSDGSLRFPLSLLIRPELIEQLKERAIPSKTMKGMPHVPAEALSLSDVSKEEFFKKLGATTISEDRLDDPDPFGRSNRPQSGFKPGPRRRLDGKRK